MGIMALTRFTMLPVSKSAPLAFCAAIMRLVSSISVGMNRRAMDIMSASACTGNLMYFKGFSRLSRPSVRLTGVVVSVRSAEPSTKNISLNIRKIANSTPSR